MDPAAVGTTIIGLDKVRRDQARDDAGYGDQEPLPGARHRSASAHARERVALFLRRTADHLAPIPAPAAR